MRPFTVVALGVLFLCVRSSTASGQPAASADDTGKKDEARKRFLEGLSHFDRSEWDAALAEFLASRALFPTRAATMDAAICLRQEKRFDEALDMWETLVREYPDLSAGDKVVADREIADLRRSVGAIDVRATEPGASVVVDGHPRGTTPLIQPLRVGVGTHVVRVHKDGFAQFEARVEVAGLETAVAEARLQALTQSGRLQVTEQQGRSLDVLVDNVIVGKTPWTGTVAVGRHVLALRGEGDVGTQPVDAIVGLNQSTPLTLLAEHLEASARIEPTPPGAPVAIDGVVVGHGVWEGRLRAGTHKIEVGEDGFVPFSAQITMDRGQHRVVLAQLERDSTSSIWATHAGPKFFVEVDGSFVVSPSFGGLGCPSPCTASLPVGGQGVAHVGYQHPTGFGFGVDGGYLSLTQTLKGRASTLTAVGGDVRDNGTLTDSLRVSGVTLGASAFYRRGDVWPVTLRVGVGVLLGSANDARAGQFVATTSQATYDVSATEAPGATYLYAAPEARLGRRFGEHVELSLGVQAMVLTALRQPRWNDGNSIVLDPQATGAQREGLGGFPSEAVVGSILVAVTPGAGVRVEF